MTEAEIIDWLAFIAGIKGRAAKLLLETDGLPQARIRGMLRLLDERMEELQTMSSSPAATADA